MASYYEILKIMSDWLVKKGIKRLDAQKYITTLFLALSEDAVVNSKKELKHLVKDSQTPKGLNEQGLIEMNKKGVYKSVINTFRILIKISTVTTTARSWTVRRVKSTIRPLVIAG